MRNEVEKFNIISLLLFIIIFLKNKRSKEVIMISNTGYEKIKKNSKQMTPPYKKNRKTIKPE